MNREVHVRFWESPEVKVLRATRHSRRFRRVHATSGYPPKLTVEETWRTRAADLKRKSVEVVMTLVLVYDIRVSL